MKQSRIRRLIPKKLALRHAEARGATRARLEKLVERESADTIAKMRTKGYTLVTRLESGEGVFVREDDVMGLHVQIPRALYRQLDSECKRREVSKKRLVVEALEAHMKTRGAATR